MAVSIGRTVAGLWQTTAMLEAWQTAIPAPSFVRDNLFPKRDTTSANAVMIDYYKESMRLAPWVSPIVKGRVMNRDKFKTSLFEPGYLKPVRPLHPVDLWDRIPGEALGSPNAAAREAEILAIDMASLDRMIARVEEQLCCDCLTTGKVLCYSIEGDEKLPLAEIDYEIQPIVVAAPPWDDPTADPLRDLKAAMRQLSAMSGAQCDFCVMGAGASDAFEVHPTVIEGYNKYWIRPGILSPAEQAWGVQVLGTNRGITLFSYGGFYQDDMDASVMRPYLPDDLVIIASKLAGTGSVAYGGVWQESDDEDTGPKHHVLYEGERIWYNYFEDEIRYLRCTSRPVPVPPNLNNYLVMKVLP